MGIAPDERPAIAFSDVGLTIAGLTIIAGLDLGIRKGEIVSVIGPSGCGKRRRSASRPGSSRPRRGVS